ncbi:hypothetical protein [Algiphilus sp.]|uniref:hypothetical protein n=1 Tax=Algiphilus sp. TaxID=1872431 RepID=UPI0025C2A046|nr:hypothetical protein [Algiphilus sp.]MCK5770892.1 hypothetical protein [Algiphilus sp.]
MSPVRNPNAIPTLLIVVGAALAVYHGPTVWEHEPMTDHQVEAEARAQLEALEERRGPHLSTIQGEQRSALLERLEAEVRGVHERPYREAARWFFLGVGCLIIGAGHRLAGWLSGRHFGG